MEEEVGWQNLHKQLIIATIIRIKKSIDKQLKKQELLWVHIPSGDTRYVF